jgi:hypothetical protein
LRLPTYFAIFSGFLLPYCTPRDYSAMPRAKTSVLRLLCTLCGKTIRCTTSLTPHYRREHKDAFDSETGQTMARLGPVAVQNCRLYSLASEIQLC